MSAFWSVFKVMLLAFAVYFAAPHLQAIINRTYYSDSWKNLEKAMSLGWLPLVCAAIVVGLYIWSELRDKRKIEKERREVEERWQRIEKYFETIVRLLHGENAEREDKHAKATKETAKHAKKQAKTSSKKGKEVTK